MANDGILDCVEKLRSEISADGVIAELAAIAFADRTELAKHE